jgi:hypothetical protein
MLGVSLKRSFQIVFALLVIGWAALHFSNKSILYWEETNSAEIQLCEEEYVKSVEQWKEAVKNYRDADDTPCVWVDSSNIKGEDTGPMCIKHNEPDWLYHPPIYRCPTSPGKKWVCHYFSGRRVFTHKYPRGYGANDGCPAFFRP